MMQQQGQQPQTSPSAEQVWQALTSLRRDKRLGPAVYRAYEWLWHSAGYRPADVLFTLADLAAEYNVDHRAAWGWIARLVELGLVHVIDRNRRNGSLRLYVYEPLLPEARRLDPDPQGELHFDPSQIPEQESPQEPGPPVLRLLEVASRFARENLDDVEKCAQKPRPRRDLRAEISTPEVETPPAVADFGEPVVEICAQKPRRPFMNHERDTLVSHPHSFMDHENHEASSHSEPLHIGAALLAAIEARTDPDQLRRAKAELATWVERRIGDSKMHPSIAQRAAAAVVEHGLAQSELEYWVDATCNKRNAGELRAPGAYFLSLARSGCRERGIPWPEYGDPAR